MSPNILIIPFIVSFLSAMIAKKEKTVRLSSLVFSFLGSVALMLYATPFILGWQRPWITAWWRMDSFSAMMVVLIACVYLFSILISVRYIGHEYEERIISFVQYKMYFSLFPLFALCMLLTVMTNDVLLLWLSLEGTTLSSTFLVGLYCKKTSIEAAWKYMILCSTGISLGLLGVLLFSYGAYIGGMASGNIFLLDKLAENAQFIPINIVKLAFIFLFIGFGTKVGLVPMHTWLPDAHSKAPSPVSAIFSAILLNVALYAILRFKFIADSTILNVDWTNNLFLIFGFISIILPALMMLIQSNYKRMLAYSSIEHMGLIVFSIGLSPLGAVAGVMHIIAHTFVKSALFFGAGEVLIRWKTTKKDKIKNMFLEAKYTSILFLLGILAIIAIPPSALFVSEYGLFSQAIILHPIMAIFLFILLGIIAYAMLEISLKMIFATEENSEDKEIEKEKWNITHTIMTAELLIVILLTGIFTTGGGVAVIENIAKTFLFVK